LQYITVETLQVQVEISRSRRVSKDVGHFVRKFQTEGDVAHKPPLVSES